MDVARDSVLIVDDHEENLIAFSALLGDLARVETARSGLEALEIAQHRSFAVILIDVMMPDMDGFETAIHLRQRPENQSTPIIFVTAGTPDDARIFQGYSLGAVDYILKPVSDLILRSKVSVFVELARKTRREIEQRLEAARLRADLDVERRNAEVSALFRLFVETVRDYAIFMMDPDGYITSWNKGAERVLGFSQGEILGKHFSIIFPARAIETRVPEKELQKAASEGRAEDVRWHLKKNGQLFWANGIVSPLEMNGTLLGFCKILEDQTSRKRAEEVHAERAKLLELTYDAVLVRNASDDRITFWNRTAAELYGFTSGEAKGRISHELLQTVFSEPIEKIKEELFKNSRWEGELTHRCKRGQTMVVLSRWALERDESGKPTKILETNTNISEKKKSEEKLKNSERTLRLLVEGVRDYALIMLNVDGRVAHWNPGAEKAFGYRQDEVIGRPVSIFFTPEDRDAGIPEKEMEIARAEGCSESERWHVRSDGAMFWASGTITPLWDEHNELKGYAKLLHDDTLRKQSEMERARVLVVERTEQEETQKALTLLNAIFETAPVGLASFDTDYHYIRVNRTLADMSGVSAEDHIGRSVAQLRPDSWPLLREKLKSVIENGQPLLNIETVVKIPTAKNETRHWILSFYPLRSEEGQIVGATKVAVDVTDQKEAENELRRLAGQLRRSNEDLERFAYAASHDLQEPLRTISAYLGLLDRHFGSDLGKDAKEYFEFAMDGARRMRTLIDDLLRYSQIQSGEMPSESIQSEDSVQAAIKNLRQAIDETNAMVHVDPLPNVKGNHSQLTLLFQNLVGNAIKYRGENRPQIRIGCADDGHEWRFSVRDNGIGFSQQDAGRIFNAFERLQNRKDFPGSGIGLATCKKIADSHGGRIWAEAVPGDGSTFYFTIPKRG